MGILGIVSDMIFNLKMGRYLYAKREKHKSIFDGWGRKWPY